MENTTISKPPENSQSPSRSVTLSLSALIFVAALLLASSTIPRYGITWDEPLSFFEGVTRMHAWITAVQGEIYNGRTGSAFSREFTRQYWQPPTPETQRHDFYNNHPPVTRIAGYLTWLLLNRVAGDLFSMRFAAALAYASMISLVFLMGCEVSHLAGFLASCFVMTIPRLFAFSHFLTTEIFLVLFWVLGAFALWRAIRSERRFWYISFWVICGVAVNVKFPALLIPFPLLLFTLLYHRRQIMRLMAWSPIGILPAYMLNPTWWHDPLSIFYHNHILLSLRRTSYFNPSVFYLGKVLFRAPWHYPLIQMLMTLPVIILALFCASLLLFFFQWRNKQLSALAIITTAVITFFACIPGAPRYDGVRLFLPVFPFVGLAAALTASAALESCLRFSTRLGYPWAARMAGFGLLLIILGYQVKQTCVYIPYELSYYNELSGGLSGAFKLGMEATYLLEAITPDFVTAINRILPSGASLGNFPEDGAILRWYQRNGILRGDIRIMRIDKAEFIIVVNRRSSLRTNVLQKLDMDHEAVLKTEIDGVPLVVLFAPRRRDGEPGV